MKIISCKRINVVECECRNREDIRVRVEIKLDILCRMSVGEDGRASEEN